MLHVPGHKNTAILQYWRWYCRQYCLITLSSCNTSRSRAPAKYHKSLEHHLAQMTWGEFETNLLFILDVFFIKLRKSSSVEDCCRHRYLILWPSSDSGENDLQFQNRNTAQLLAWWRFFLGKIAITHLWVKWVDSTIIKYSQVLPPLVYLLHRSLCSVAKNYL